MSPKRLLDGEGRLFGRLNLVDAAALLVVCLLIPLGYGAYLLFRPPQARILAVEPVTVPEGTREVKVRGEGLRPYLRMTVDQTAATFLFANSDEGVLLLPVLPPGSYDVVLMDEGTEIARLRDGLVVGVPEESAEVLAVGAFVELSADDAKALAARLQSTEHPPATWGAVLGIQPAEPNTHRVLPSLTPVFDGRYRVSAVLRLACVLQESECRMNGIALKPTAVISLPVGDRNVAFHIDEIHSPPASVADVLIRAQVTPEEMMLFQRSDPPGNGFPALDALRPTVAAVTRIGETTDRHHIVNIRLRVPVVLAREISMSDGRVLRVGENFIFEFPLERGVQRLNGRILALQVEAAR